MSSDFKKVTGVKRFLGITLTAVCLLVQMPTVSAVGTSASSAILMDASGGRILYEQNAHERRLIASITKLMTALVALESGHELDEVVTITPAWAGAEGSSIYLQAGEEITLETLLYGMLLRSGNDAALAVAGYCGGTVDNFVAHMNEKASQLGMTDSHFANPNGLNTEGHYSSAYDMALLARACLSNETLTKMVSTKSITLGTRIFTNHNKLLWQYEGCIGMKTGFTEKAGRTLVSAAERDGMKLVCVTLNDPNDWADHSGLFDYGFANYRGQVLAQSGETLCRVPVTGGLVSFCPVVTKQAAEICLAPGEELKRELLLERTTLEAPVSAGRKMGEAVYYLNGSEIARIPLVSGAKIDGILASKQGMLNRLWERLAELSA